jgi:hypothetical protein
MVMAMKEELEERIKGVGSNSWTLLSETRRKEGRERAGGKRKPVKEKKGGRGKGRLLTIPASTMDPDEDGEVLARGVGWRMDVEEEAVFVVDLLKRIVDRRVRDGLESTYTIVKILSYKSSGLEDEDGAHRRRRLRTLLRIRLGLLKSSVRLVRRLLSGSPSELAGGRSSKPDAEEDIQVGRGVVEASVGRIGKVDDRVGRRAGGGRRGGDVGGDGEGVGEEG